MKWARLSSEVKQQRSKLFYHPSYEDDDAENKKGKKEGKIE